MKLDLQFVWLNVANHSLNLHLIKTTGLNHGEHFRFWLADVSGECRTFWMHQCDKYQANSVRHHTCSLVLLVYLARLILRIYYCCSKCSINHITLSYIYHESGCCFPACTSHLKLYLFKPEISHLVSSSYTIIPYLDPGFHDISTDQWILLVSS